MPGGAGQTLTNKVISKVVNYRVDVSFSKGLIKPFLSGQYFLALVWRGEPFPGGGDHMKRAARHYF
jgi:hypothetical protein